VLPDDLSKARLVGVFEQCRHFGFISVQEQEVSFFLTDFFEQGRFAYLTWPQYDDGLARRPSLFYFLPEYSFYHFY
jgi:hypothetical protein